VEELRTPCAHRGTEHVVTSPVDASSGDLVINICSTCRRFWLERNGWLLSRREAAAVVRAWPYARDPARAAR
jgi:hypothetical protein